MGWKHRNIRSNTLLNILKAGDVYVNPQSTRRPAPGDTLTSYLQPSDIHSSRACTLLQHSLRQTARHMTSQQRSETDSVPLQKYPFYYHSDSITQRWLSESLLQRTCWSQVCETTQWVTHTTAAQITFPPPIQALQVWTKNISPKIINIVIMPIITYLCFIIKVHYSF